MKMIQCEKHQLNFILIIFLGVILMQACSTNNSNQKYDYSFLDLQKKLETQNKPEKRQELVDNFLKNIDKMNYPIFESDTTVVLLFKSDSDSAFVLGDMANWAGYFPMTKIKHTNLFYFRDNYVPDARLEYWVSTEREGLAGVDPLNPFKVWNGFGPMSELAMPKYERHPYFTEYIRLQLNQLQDSLDVNVYEDGLRVYTTLDTRFQHFMDTTIDSLMPAFQARVRRKSSLLKKHNIPRIKL